MRAERAEEVAGLDELVEAALVDEVVARRDLRGLAGGVDVLLADGAVGAREVLDALQEERKGSVVSFAVWREAKYRNCGIGKQQ